MTALKNTGLIMMSLLYVLATFGCEGIVADEDTPATLSTELETGQQDGLTEETDVQLTDPGIQYEEKIYWTGTINDPFAGDSVTVIMDKNTGGINKEHDISFFGGIDIVSIRDVSRLTGAGISAMDNTNFRQILSLNLPVDCKENVVNVIRQLEKIDGIKYAGPNHIFNTYGPIQSY